MPGAIRGKNGATPPRNTVGCQRNWTELGRRHHCAEEFAETSGYSRCPAVDCCQHGFIPLVVRDAVGDRAPAPHEANLFDLQAKYAEVLTLERVRAWLSGLGASPSG